MRNDLTDMTVVLDRSGSMANCQSDAEGGLNRFIEDQKKAAGEAVFTLIQFDTEYEFVHQAVPIQDVPKCTLTPRGWTALLDAIGRGIIETGERLKNMPADQRPGLVVFVIVTDGHENSSREFRKDKIREMIQHQQDVYQWQFTFLGANQDAFSEADGLGVARAAAAKYVNAAAAFRASSDNVCRMRHATVLRCKIDNSFTEQERELMASSDDHDLGGIPNESNSCRPSE